jgi:hypothetical protein
VHFSRRVEAGFTAGQVSSDGGALLLREVEGKINLLGRLAACFSDGRDPDRVEHPLPEMLSQRIYGLALGYEDLNDHEQLRSDPLFGLLSGKRELESPLAGKSTLNRLELIGRTERYHKIGYAAESIDRLLVDLYIESHATAPAEVVLDLDATDIPLYGHQPERFFHGYYDSYCYLPLYIFAGDQLLCARLRPANQDAAAGSVEEVKRIVAQLREHWGEVKIVLRADSGFCREKLMGWCEANEVDYVFGLQRNTRLRKIIGKEMHQLSDAQELVLLAPHGGQGRVSGQGRESALHRHFVDRGGVGRAGPIREVLLRSRRDGEPHQGTDVPVRRPALYQRDRGQSAAALVLGLGLHADRGPAPPGPERNRLGPGPGRHRPAQAVQDRRHRAH